MSIMRMLVFALIPLMVCTSAAAAVDDKPNLVLNLTVEKQVTVKDDEGNTEVRWRQVAETAPGDILRYTIAYVNAGRSEARNAVIVDPVPRGRSSAGPVRKAHRTCPGATCRTRPTGRLS